MSVKGWGNARQLAASTPGLDCVFDYAAWWDASDNPLEVQMEFDSPPSALSFHFAFASSSDGDPFRLLIVNETNAPAPLLLGRELVKIDSLDVRGSLQGPLRELLFANYTLLDGRQWQLEPLIQSETGATRCLYRDWPARDLPPPEQELDLTALAQRLRAERQEPAAKVAVLSEPVKRPLGHALKIGRPGLGSFAEFAGGDLSPDRFLDYLDKLRKAAPEDSWIKKWGGHVDAIDPDEAARKMQNLYMMWTNKVPEDQALLTVTNKAGTVTNYFMSTWQLLKDTAPAQAKLAKLQTRLDEVTRVAYIGLFIVDPRQSRPGLEMIRFPAP
jgi:hypothetical protein